MGGARERLLHLLLRLDHRCRRERPVATEIAQAMLDLEEIGGQLAQTNPEALYGVPAWLVDRLDAVIASLETPGDLLWSEVAGLLWEAEPGAADDRLPALRETARLARLATRPASQRLRQAVFDPEEQPAVATLSREAAERRTRPDLPVAIPGDEPCAVLVSLEVRFEQGDAARPSSRSTNGSGAEFQAGVEAGLRAAHDLVLRLGVPAAVRERHAHLDYALGELPGDLPPVTGLSAGLPVALHVLGEMLELGPLPVASTGPIAADGRLERLDETSARAKLGAVAADGIRAGLICNSAAATAPVPTLAAAAASVWGNAWTRRAMGLLEEKLQRVELRMEWRLPWSTLPPPRQLDGIDLIGDTGEEEAAERGLRAARGAARLLLGPPGSGRTTLVSRVSSELTGHGGDGDWGVVRLVPAQRVLPPDIAAIDRDLRIALPSPARLLLVVDHVDPELEELTGLLDLELDDPDATLLVVSNRSLRPQLADMDALADSIVAELGSTTALEVARGVVAKHPRLEGVDDQRLRPVVRRARGDLAAIVDRLAQIAGDPTAEATEVRLSATTADAPVRSLLTLACRSAVGIGTPGARLDEKTLALASSLGAASEDDGWLIRSPRLAEDLVETCATRVGGSRRATTILRDQLAQEVRSAADEYADAEVVAILAAVARRRPALLGQVLSTAEQTIEEWATRADVRAMRGFLLVARAGMDQRRSDSLVRLFAVKLIAAVEGNELTALQLARSLRLLLSEHPVVLEGQAGEINHRKRMLAAIAVRLDELLGRSGTYGRRQLLGQLLRLDFDASVLASHAAAALGTLRPENPHDQRLALAVLRAMRGLPSGADPVADVVGRVRGFTEAVRRRPDERANRVVLALALAAELERHGEVLDAPRATEGQRERDYRIVEDASARVAALFDRSSPSALIEAVGELARVNKGMASLLLYKLEKDEGLADRLATRLKRLSPSRAARVLEGLAEVGDSMALTVLFRQGRRGRAVRGTLVRGLKAGVARTLDARGAVGLLRASMRVDHNWGHRRDGFAHALCQEIGIDLLIELIDMHPHDRVVADLVDAVVATRPSTELMRQFSEQAFAPLLEAMLRTGEVAWPARAALSLGSDDNPHGAAYLDRLREDPQLAHVLAERMTTAHNGPTFVLTNRLALALFPDRARAFRESRAWLPTITEAWSLTDAVAAFETASFMLSQATETEGSAQAAARLREEGWSWREALALGTSPQRVAEVLGRLWTVHFPSAMQAVSAPEQPDEEDRLLGWLMRNDGHSLQVHADLLHRVAHIDRARAGELLARFRADDPRRWARLVNVAASDPNPRTQARIYRGLGAAGYDPPSEVRAERLEAWTSPEGVISTLRRPPAISELLRICFEWGGGLAAVRAIDRVEVTETLRYGRGEDLLAAQRLTGQLWIVTRRFEGGEAAASRCGLSFARAIGDLDDLPERLNMRNYARLIGVVCVTDPDLSGRLREAALRRLDEQVGKRHRWRPANHWVGIGWLAWQLGNIGVPARITTAEPPASLDGVSPALRLFGLAWLDGPSWVERRLARDFETVEAQSLGSSGALVAILAAAARHGRTAATLNGDHDWDRLFDASPGVLTALVPALRAADPDLIRFLRAHPRRPPLVERLRAETRLANFGAGLVLDALEGAGLASPQPSPSSSATSSTSR